MPSNQANSQPLEAGQWQGEAFNRFKAELDNEVYPAFQRLNTLFSVSQEITLKISKLFEAAEAEAATLFKWEHGPAQGSQAFQAVASNARSLEARSDLILNFLGYNPSAKPESLWAAPFVAGAALFGPGPVPILGKWALFPVAILMLANGYGCMLVVQALIPFSRFINMLVGDEHPLN
ncbi:WXG100 family type VII secretion target [Herpetosiphon geysericola]|uniref:WXG100 family type VII secretion target n=1 Tax=Herpetosiphon geysericola TaxID=70996 RepID=UPI0009F90681|nr:WXG100 family type VII secretion target [Herpetosiphon geysericola]